MNPSPLCKGTKRSGYGEGGEAVLEDLAIAFRGAAEAARGNARGAAEGADEIGKVGEADVERDAGEGTRSVGEQPRRRAQPGAHEVLVRRDAEHFRERAQEVIRAEAR